MRHDCLIALGRLAIAAIALIGPASLPAAAAFSNSVRFIIPGPPGGTNDILARIIADALSQQGVRAIVDYKPGGSGVIAINALLAAPADGRTLMVSAQNVLTEVPLVMKTPFDALRDLRPIAEVGRASLVLITHPSVPAVNLTELIDYARTQRGKLNYASYSTGTASHFAGLMLNQKAGIDLQHVPYRGSAPALADLAAGQLSMMFDGMPTALQFVRSGRVKALAVSGQQRSALLPQVPTFAELGYSDIQFTNWIGVIGSGRIAPELAARLNAEIIKAVTAPKVRERLMEAGFELSPVSTPAELQQSVRRDYERNARIVKAFDIKSE